jgi:hypothetical protein
LDRGFDDNGLFDYIDTDLNDEFVIRLKASRLAEQSTQEKVKLLGKAFAHQHTEHYTKIQIKSKAYQNANSVIEWGEQLSGYNVVKITLRTREGKDIFKAPLLLITNKKIESAAEALVIYRIYLKRSKIESVFKFLKEVLGWEECQIRDFQSMKNLLSFCYFVAGYFYEIEAALIENDVVQFIANLGGGKGKVTRHYILEGLSKLVIKKVVDDAIEEFAITPEQIKKILELAMRGY